MATTKINLSYFGALLVALAAIGVLVLVGCGSNDDSPATPTAATTSTITALEYEYAQGVITELATFDAGLRAVAGLPVDCDQRCENTPTPDQSLPLLRSRCERTGPISASDNYRQDLLGDLSDAWDSACERVREGFDELGDDASDPRWQTLAGEVVDSFEPVLLAAKARLDGLPRPAR